MTFARDVQQGLSPYRAKLNDCVATLIRYLRNPVQAMRTLPDWDWIQLGAFHGAIAATCGLVSGLVTLRFAKIFSGIILFPISTTFLVMIASGFFYYTFLFVFHREMSFRKLVTVVVFANIPNLVLSIAAGYLPPMALVSMGVSSALLIVGLVEITNISRKSIVKLVGLLFGLYCIFWVYGVISSSQEKNSIKDMATPESLDILEKEMRTDE